MIGFKTLRPLIELDQLSKKYSSQVVFENLSYQIPRGDFVSLLGPSGCGKSTLLRIIAGLESPTSGKLNTDQEFRKTFSFVFQDPQLLNWRTALENVILPLEIGPQKSQFTKKERIHLALEALKKVGLSEHQGKFPHELSGGMKMRVSLARALVSKPQVLLMDEPFAALDENTRFEMQNELLQLFESEKLTVIFVTHSISEAAYLSKHILLFKGPQATNWERLEVQDQPSSWKGNRQDEKLLSLINYVSQRMQL